MIASARLKRNSEEFLFSESVSVEKCDCQFFPASSLSPSPGRLHPFSRRLLFNGLISYEVIAAPECSPEFLRFKELSPHSIYFGNQYHSTVIISNGRGVTHRATGILNPLSPKMSHVTQDHLFLPIWHRQESFGTKFPNSPQLPDETMARRSTHRYPRVHTTHKVSQAP